MPSSDAGSNWWGRLPTAERNTVSRGLDLTIDVLNVAYKMSIPILETFMRTSGAITSEESEPANDGPNWQRNRKR